MQKIRNIEACNYFPAYNIEGILGLGSCNSQKFLIYLMIYSFSPGKVKSKYEQNGPSGRQLSPVSVTWTNHEYFYFPLYGMFSIAGLPPRNKLFWQYTFMHLGGEKQCESQVSLPKNTTQCSWLELKPGPVDLESCALHMKPLCLAQGIDPLQLGSHDHYFPKKHHILWAMT